MSEYNFQFTEVMSKDMKSWGWRFIGINFKLDPQWYKYERGTLVASFGDEVWSRDFAAARLAAQGEIRDLGIPPTLSMSERDAMKDLGWRWAMTDVDSGEWLKFRDNGVCVARRGDLVWVGDIALARQTKVMRVEDAELCQSVIDFLEHMGWKWFRHESGTCIWVKFNSAGNAEAAYGGNCWTRDLKSAKRLAGSDVKAWEPTMYLRQYMTFARGEIHLQQKWQGTLGSGGTEWRDVPYVDSKGVPIV